MKQTGQQSRKLIPTVDHSDIRGSSLAARHHGRDPSGAASDWGRESGRRACRIGFHEDSPFRVPYRLLPALLHHNHLFYAAFFCWLELYFCSTSTAIAQINPKSSLATAVIAFCLIAPFAISLIYR